MEQKHKQVEKSETKCEFSTNLNMWWVGDGGGGGGDQGDMPGFKNKDRKSFHLGRGKGED